MRVVALAAGASHRVMGSLRAHGIRGGSAYIALHRSWSVSAVLASATWGSGRGCAVWTHAVLSDWVVFGFPPRTSRTLSIALTGGHDSLFLRHPAIDTVWRWPCLPRFRLL